MNKLIDTVSKNVLAELKTLNSFDTKITTDKMLKTIEYYFRNEMINFNYPKMINLWITRREIIKIVFRALEKENLIESLPMIDGLVIAMLKEREAKE